MFDSTGLAAVALMLRLDLSDPIHAKKIQQIIHLLRWMIKTKTNENILMNSRYNEEARVCDCNVHEMLSAMMPIIRGV